MSSFIFAAYFILLLAQGAIAQDNTTEAADDSDTTAAPKCPAETATVCENTATNEKCRLIFDDLG